MTTVAIVGYGTAAANAIIGLRTSGYEDRILVFSNTGEAPYSPVLTTYYAGGTKTREECFLWSEEQLAFFNVEVIDGSVEALDCAAHTVSCDGQKYVYDKCVIASGATPVTTGFPEAPGFEPYVMRTLADAQRLGTVLQEPGCKVLVSGSSMVALKVVEACLDRGADATLLARSAHVLRRSALPEVAARFEAGIASEGVKLRMRQSVVSVTADNEATFSDGSSEKFDAIVVAHGMKPNLGFLLPGALDMDKGLLVYGNMRTSDPDVYTAGDVAQVKNLCTGEREIAGLWKQAALQGQCAGQAIAAELMGEDAATAPGYDGFIPNNTVYVHGTTLVSGGVVDAAGSEARFTETEDGVVAEVYDAARKLVGFNAFNLNGKPGSHVFDEGMALLRRLEKNL